MGLTYKPLHPLFATEICGVNLRDQMDIAIAQAVEAAMAEYGVVVLRGQDLSEDDHIRFSRYFGPLEYPPSMGVQPPAPGAKRHRVYGVSNVDENGDILPADSPRHLHNKANEFFHADSSFNVLPTKWSLLYGIICPPERADTEFIDTRAVYEVLPEPLKAQAWKAVAEHDFLNSRVKTGIEMGGRVREFMPPAAQRVIRTTPSGRIGMLIGGHMTKILGWPEEDGRRFIAEINAFAAQPQFIYAHKWRAGDLVIWDNRFTLHRATSFDHINHKRVMRRTTISEYGPEMASTDLLPRAAATFA
jgi:alpha-ketoglutarate-dependent 2,4-dichlorophenoxyacetate dioxygenase